MSSKTGLANVRKKGNANVCLPKQTGKPMDSDRNRQNAIHRTKHALSSNRPIPQNQQINRNVLSFVQKVQNLTMMVFGSSRACIYTTILSSALAQENRCRTAHKLSYTAGTSRPYPHVPVDTAPPPKHRGSNKSDRRVTTPRAQALWAGRCSDARTPTQARFKPSINKRQTVKSTLN